MKAILIDPVAETVTEVEHDGDYHQIYELLSDKEHGLNVGTFEIVRLGVKTPDDKIENTLYVDENGLLNEPRYFFIYQGYHQPLAGRGLILGTTLEDETDVTDEGGKSIGTTLTVEEVRSRVAFKQLSVEGFEQSEGVTDHPVFGRTPFIRSRPIFGPPKDPKAAELEANRIANVNSEW